MAPVVVILTLRRQTTTSSLCPLLCIAIGIIQALLVTGTHSGMHCCTAAIQDLNSVVCRDMHTGRCACRKRLRLRRSSACD